jgi:hypothetical protein
MFNASDPALELIDTTEGDAKIIRKTSIMPASADGPYYLFLPFGKAIELESVDSSNKY